MFGVNYFCRSTTIILAGALAVTPEAPGQLDGLQYRQIQVPATPGASAPRRSTAAAAISGPRADGTGSGIRRPCSAPGTVPAAPRSSAPHVYPAPLRNGPRKRSAERSRRKRGDRPTARLPSASVYTCTLVRDSGAAPRRRTSGQSNVGQPSGWPARASRTLGHRQSPEGPERSGGPAQRVDGLWLSVREVNVPSAARAFITASSPMSRTTQVSGSSGSTAPRQQRTRRTATTCGRW